MAVTIQDIARHLNLAPSTVSKALNNYPHIASETKLRVQEAARELSYYPSAAARNLRRRRTNRVGFSYGYTTTDIGEYASRIINGAVAAAEKADFNVMLYPLTENQLEKLTRICKTREIDGLLLMGGNQLAESIQLLQAEKMPFVVLNRRFDQDDIPFVTADYQTATVEAVHHLADLGHQRIAYVGQETLEYLHSDRILSYKQALKRTKLPLDETLIKSAGVTPGDGYQVMQQLLALDQPPTAVVVIHDPLAIECLQAVTDAGLKIPDDIALIGSDNLRESQTTEPPLTTIHPPLAEVGRQAMEQLLLRLADETMPVNRSILSASLVIRQSTVG